MTATERLSRAFNRPNSRYKFRELVDITGTTARKTNSLIEELRASGLKIIYGKVDHCYFLSKIPTPYSNSFDLSHLPREGKFGAISDTHLCSDAERLDLLRYAYNEMKSQGVTTVLHAGDLTDGWEVYQGHAQFVKVGGGAKQARYAIKNYPHVEGITTYFISGNHDLKSYLKTGLDQASLITSGVEVEGHFTEGRKDMVYLGQHSRYIRFPDEISIHLLHPHGSNPYAKSYAMQKRSRAFNNQTRPDIQLSGHLHTFTWIKEDYTHMIALAGVQDETEFFKRLGLQRDMGFCIIDYAIEKHLIRKLRVQYVNLD